MPTSEFNPVGPSGEGITIFRPDTSTVGKMPFIYAHGFAFTTPMQAYITNHSQRDFLEAVARFTGMPVLVPHLGGNITFGNTAFVNAITACVTWAGTNLGTRTDKVFLAGESMGSLISNWAWRNPDKVGGLYLLVPITDLEAFRVRNVATFGTTVQDSYGGLSAYNAARPAHDPALNRAALAAMGDRVRVEYMYEDEFLPPGEVEGFAEAIGASSRVGHSGTHIQAYSINHEDAVAWIRRTMRVYS